MRFAFKTAPQNTMLVKVPRRIGHEDNSAIRPGY
jgi:hypothetical protein